MQTSIIIKMQAGKLRGGWWRKKVENGFHIQKSCASECEGAQKPDGERLSTWRKEESKGCPRWSCATRERMLIAEC